jgi:hypothetical protein
MAGGASRTLLGDWGLFFVVILAVTGAFGLGRLSVQNTPQNAVVVQNTASPGSSLGGGGAGPGDPLSGPIAGAYVAAKTGSYYYFPWCTDALKIAPDLRRWFMDEKSAQAAGYTPAKNCRGMPKAGGSE